MNMQDDGFGPIPTLSLSWTSWIHGLILSTCWAIGGTPLLYWLQWSYWPYCTLLTLTGAFGLSTLVHLGILMEWFIVYRKR